MLKTTLTQKRGTSRPHVKQPARLTPEVGRFDSDHLRDRMRACVSQDRCEALGLQVPAQAAAAPAEPGSAVRSARASEVEIGRTLLLDVVGRESDLIRASLNLCERITKVTSK